MKKDLSVLMTVISISILLFTVASCTHEQSPQEAPKLIGSGGWDKDTAYSKMFDPKTIETISGEIISIDKIIPIRGMFHGYQMIVKTDKETISVHTGPGWFMEQKRVKFMPKDKVEVTGSRINFDGKPVIIGTEVKRDDYTLKLRDETGFPVWDGWWMSYP